MCTNSSTLPVSNNALVHSVPCNAGSEHSDRQLTDPPDLLPLPDHDQGHLCVCDAGTDGQASSWGQTNLTPTIIIGLSTIVCHSSVWVGMQWADLERHAAVMFSCYPSIHTHHHD